MAAAEARSALIEFMTMASSAHPTPVRDYGLATPFIVTEMATDTGTTDLLSSILPSFAKENPTQMLF